MELHKVILSHNDCEILFHSQHSYLLFVITRASNIKEKSNVFQTNRELWHISGEDDTVLFCTLETELALRIISNSYYFNYEKGGLLIFPQK